jgi:dihydroxyacid dehydratase/phosphogluconate dehydratase
MSTESVNRDPSKLRSRKWFANPDNPNMTALYLERYMNFGLKREELQAGKPIIGIAQSGSDLSPCNRHHLELAHRVREGIREAGGIAFEFPGSPDPGDRQASRPRRSTAIFATSGSSRRSTAISSTAWCSRPAATRRRPRS